MKKHFLYLASLLLSVLVISCSEQQELSVQTNGVSFTIDKFIEDTPSSLATKTSVDPSNNFAITWANGDTVGIFPLEGFQEPFKIPANQVGQSSVSFNGGYWQIKDGLSYNAYYPFSTKNFQSSDMVTKIPVTYVGQYQNGHDCNAGAYDYTYSDWSTASMGNVNFAFHHLGSFLVLSLPLPATATYTQLTLQSSSANLPTKGTYDLTAATPSFMADANSLSSTFEMELTDFRGTKDEVAVFYMMIPPMDLTGSTVRVTLTAENGSCSYTLDNMSRVFQAGKLYRRTGTLVDTSVTGTVDPWEDEEETPTPEYVDLGLSVKWATFNIGATKPEEYGDYFAWGATEPLYEAGYAQENPQQHWKDGKADGYTWVNTPYQTVKDAYLASSSAVWTKYLGSTPFDWYADPSASEEDALKAILDPEDDAAHVNWGDKWRMPTKEEQDELRNNCTWTWTTLNGVNGYKVQSKKPGYTDNWVFLPAAGMRIGTNLVGVGEEGDYRSCSLDLNYYIEAKHAYYLLFDQGSVEFTSPDRQYGFSIRPVYSSEDLAAGITGITLNKSSLSMHPDDTETLVATVSKIAGAVVSDQVVWYSSNENIAYVTTSGKVYAFQPGTATITAKTVFGGFEASCTVTVTPVYEYVDLGLSVKWATMNVGANAPEEYGDYFAWGETEPLYEAGWAQENPQAHWKDGKEGGYAWSSYIYCNGAISTLTKYNKDSSYGYNGFTDNKTILEPEDDAAHVNWGGDWRMPTKAEQVELLNNCTWTWTTLHGHNGYKVQSKKTGYTDKWIFLPAAGSRINGDLNSVGDYASYWASSINPDIPYYPCYLYFNSYSHSWGCNNDRCDGRSVRPVCP